MWPQFSLKCRRDVDAVLRSGRLTGYRATEAWGVGPAKWSHAYKFEREIEKAFGVKHAIAVNSGTAALHAILHSLDLKGREVITSPLTFSATASAILMAGGIPRFADVDPHTFCITPETVKPHVTKKTGAILPVHLFGYLPSMPGLLGMGLPVVEDACQSVGARRDGRFAGSLGVAGAMSLNGSKNICAGEGGAVTTNSDEIARKARLFINHGENFQSETIGLNYRMHEVVACIARHGLRELEERNRRRIQLVNALELHLDNLCYVSRGVSHVYYVYPFKANGFNPRLNFRDIFIARCAKRGLPIQESYTTPLHHLKAFRKYCKRELPVVDELHKKTLCLLTTLTPDRPLSYAKWCAKVIREALE